MLQIRILSDHFLFHHLLLLFVDSKTAFFSTVVSFVFTIIHISTACFFLQLISMLCCRDRTLVKILGLRHEYDKRLRPET